MEEQLRNLMNEQREQDNGASLREAWDNGINMYDEEGDFQSMKFVQNSKDLRMVNKEPKKFKYYSIPAFSSIK